MIVVVEQGSHGGEVKNDATLGHSQVIGRVAVIEAVSGGLLLGCCLGPHSQHVSKEEEVVCV